MGRLPRAFIAAAALAATPASAIDYSAEQEKYCTGDAFRLCSNEIPDVDRITACMVRLQNYLSPACRAVFITEPEPPARAGSGRSRKPLSLRPNEAR